MFGRATIRLGIGPHSSLVLSLLQLISFFNHLLKYAGMSEKLPACLTLLQIHGVHACQLFMPCK